MVRLFYFWVLFSLSLNSYCTEFFDSKININDCIGKFQSERVEFCKLNLSKAYHSPIARFSREHAKNVQRKYGHFFHQKLASETDRLNFSVEAIYYLANKRIIKPIMRLTTHNHEQQLSVIIPNPQRTKGGYGLPLSNNKTETLALFNQLTHQKKIVIKIYSKDIERIFTAQ